MGLTALTVQGCCESVRMLGVLAQAPGCGSHASYSEMINK